MVRARVKTPMLLNEAARGVPVEVIPNGVDAPRAGARAPGHGLDAARRHRRALFIGRIYPVKGLPMLVEAWARVRPRGWTLRIAGPDEAGHRRGVEREIAEHGLGAGVSVLGPLEGAAKRAALLDSDLFVLPTRSENFGMAIGEALAHAVPVLTTTAAPWHFLDERECGWSVEPSVAGIAAGLRAATALDRHALRARGA